LSPFEGFWYRGVAGGATICSYGAVDEGGWGAVGVIPAVDGGGGDGVTRRAVMASVRRQCRGLVVGPGGVVARPLYKFFSVGQVEDMRGRRLAEARVLEATEKLDGAMLFGVWAGEGWELWSKGGLSKVAEEAMQWVYGEGAAEVGDLLGLLEVVEAMGCTTVFKWVGRQARVKVKEREARLVLLQVRRKVSGGYVEYGLRRDMAEVHGVAVVGSRDDLVGCSFGEALERVRQEEGRKEGVVVRLEDGQMVKIKTKWWLGAKQYEYRRWRSEEHRDKEKERRRKKVVKMQVQELRAVVVGLPGGVSPQVVLGLWGGAKKGGGVLR